MGNGFAMAVIYIDTGRKPTIDKINQQLWEDALNFNLVVWSDEEAFLNHLMRKWGNR